MPLSTIATDEQTLVVPDVRGIAGATDAQLLDAIATATAGRRRFDRVIVALTAEMSRRSDRALGQAGLAARLGARDPEQAIQSLTGATRAEAKALTAVAAAIESPWLGSVDASLTDGDLSVSAAAAISSGLGVPSADVSADDLQDAARLLVEAAHAPGVTPEALARAARQARERLELDRVADLEEHRRQKRSLTWVSLPDGTTKLIAILDPESAAIVTSAIDTALSPRRGGPRFIDAADPAQRAALEADPRTGAQLALDTLVDIVLLAERAAGSGLDPRQIFGATSPAVRVHVPVEALVTGTGSGWIEGQSAAISPDTAARMVCTSGIIPVLIAGTEPIDVGRSHRLHSIRQRIALAARWGGCAWHHCTRPPAMTEVHHPTPYDGRNTTLVNGVPLCRFHHLQLHNGGWRIETRPGTGPGGGGADGSGSGGGAGGGTAGSGGGGVTYWLVPPSDHPTDAEPTQLLPHLR